MTDYTCDEKLDLRGVLCPLNFVHTKLKLEEMEDGQLLEVILDDGEPMRNVPRSVKQEGHKIVTVERLDDGAYRLVIKANAE
ncbi:MAG: sulfurtransferase TusA family protein [Chloroflexi bacterium]|nr:sulfurtransferase TusA family protein [Chloroflexota bacterium]